MLPRPAAPSPAAIIHARATNDQACVEIPAGGDPDGRPHQTYGHPDRDVYSGTILTFEQNDFSRQAWRGNSGGINALQEHRRSKCHKQTDKRKAKKLYKPKTMFDTTHLKAKPGSLSEALCKTIKTVTAIHHTGTMLNIIESKMLTLYFGCWLHLFEQESCFVCWWGFMGFFFLKTVSKHEKKKQPAEDVRAKIGNNKPVKQNCRPQYLHNQCHRTL